MRNVEAASFRRKFRELKKLPSRFSGGALVTKINALPHEVFEVLEYLYGPYKDLFGDFVFVDGKTTWERFFKTANGIITVYDFKGSTSIGYVGKITKRLTNDAEELRVMIERFLPSFSRIKKIEFKKDAKRKVLGNFMRTFGAVAILLDETRKHGGLLEGLVLYALLTDALLRIGIILNRQLIRSDSVIEKKLIFQLGRNNYYSEREIYKIAAKEGVITNTILREASILYEYRNRAVHRYFISDFEYSDLTRILNRYQRICKKLEGIIQRLEQKQMRAGVGMVKNIPSKLDIGHIKEITKAALRKIDSTRSYVDIPQRKVLFDEKY